MKKMKLFPWIMSLALVGCGSMETKTKNPKTEVKRFTKQMQRAEDKQVDVLSPSHFSRAKKQLREANISIENRRSSKKALHDVAVGQDYLNKAEKIAKKNKSKLKDVISYRQAALEAKAPFYLKEDFRSADEALKATSLKLEKKDIKKVSNIDELKENYMDVEKDAIKEATLKESRDLIARAMEEGAEEYAPRSLAITQNNYSDTANFIETNPHKNDKIEKRKKLTFESAKMLMKITRAAKSGKKTAADQLALQLEKDYKNMLKNSDLIEQETGFAMAAQSRDKDLDKKYEDARAMFAEDEAEVYKQGDALLIRLKGLKFPSAQSTLNGANFSLLSKVEKVLSSFGQGSVLVEGHTDALGGQAQNEKISADRAAVVEDYLKSNTEDNTQFEFHAVGYGYEKPIASNKTAQGRAMNRRVDIRIEPEKENAEYSKEKWSHPKQDKSPLYQKKMRAN